MCKNSKLQADATSETNAPSNTQQNMLTIRQFSAPIAIHIPWQAKSHYREGLHHLANQYAPKREKWDPHLELRTSEIQTLWPSKKDLSNGRWAWKKARNSLDFYTRTCTEFQVHILRIETSWFFKSSPANSIFTFYNYIERERIHCGHGSFTSYDEKKLIPEEQDTIWKIEGSINYHDCKWNYSYYWSSNSKWLWFGYVCSSSIVERITRGSLAG